MRELSVHHEDLRLERKTLRRATNRKPYITRLEVRCIIYIIGKEMLNLTRENLGMGFERLLRFAH